MSSISNCIYSIVDMPYRSPDTIHLRKICDSDSNQRRALLPNVPGLGTKPTRPIKVKLPMLNGRLLQSINKEEFTLDTHAFKFTDIGSSSVKDFGNVDEVLNVYFPEVEALIRKNVPGANDPNCKVLIFDHALRSGGTLLKEQQQHSETWQGYAGIVHSDATVRSIHTRAKDQIMGTNETVVKYGKLPLCWGDVRPTVEWQNKLFRSNYSADHFFPNGRGGEHMIVNLWRPLEVVRNWGLGVLDGGSIKQGDVHPTIINKYDNSPGGLTKGKYKEKSRVYDTDGNSVPIRYGEVLTPLHDPAHRWIYFPNMKKEEGLFLKIFDSRENVNVRHGAHSAFRDPLAKDPSFHRKSIEVRCLIVFPPKLGSKL